MTSELCNPFKWSNTKSRYEQIPISNVLGRKQRKETRMM